LQVLVAERLPEALGEGGADRVGVPLAIELSQQEVFLFAQMIIGSRARVFDHVRTLITERPED
jgi:hypothetical protein